MGYRSILGDSCLKLTTINHLISDNTVFQECIEEERRKEDGEAYLVTNFDLCVCMKAFPLI